MCVNVPTLRLCERSEAIHTIALRVDCRVAALLAKTRASRPAKHSVEDRIDMFEVIAKVKTILERAHR